MVILNLFDFSVAWCANLTKTKSIDAGLANLSGGRGPALLPLPLAATAKDIASAAIYFRTPSGAILPSL